MPSPAQRPARSRFPARLAPGAFAAAAVVIQTAIDPPQSLESTHYLVSAGVTFVATWIAVALAVRSRYPHLASALGCAFVGAALAGVHGSVTGSSEQPLAIALGALVGAAVGMSTWIILPVPFFFLFVVSPETPTLDAPDRLLFKAALTLAGWVVAMVQWRGESPAVLTASALALGSALPALAYVAARDIQRALWLGAVSRGKAPSFAIVLDDGDEPVDPPLPPFAMYEEGDVEAYLIQRSSREGGRDKRIAELPATLKLARAPFLRRAALIVVAMAAIGAGIALRLGWR